MAPDIDTNPDSGERVSPLIPVVSQWNSIGFKIMLANMLALLILGFGVVMFSEYRRSVVYTELSLLEDEARLWALYLADTHANGSREILQDRVTRMMAVSPRDVTFFAPTGRVLIEKHSDLSSVTRGSDKERRLVATEPFARFILMLFPVQYDLPVYPSGGGQTIDDYPVALDDHHEGVALNAWSGQDGGLVYTAVVPVLAKGGENLGTLLLVKSVTETDEAFQMARYDIVRILLAALTITMTLSLYVAFMVGRPLNRLASAARDIRSGVDHDAEIPDLSDRGDEIGALSLVLRQTTRALRHRLDAIERFAADVAHELKNPLTSLRSAIETLPRLQDPEKHARLMKIMAEDTQRLDRLITDISRMSRLDSELAREKPEAIDLGNVIAQVLRAYVPPEIFLHADTLPGILPATIAGVQIEVYLVPHLPLVKGYSGRLEQVLSNLISNALSFTPPNGRVRVLARAVGDDVVQIRVEDDGPGIPTAKLDHVFSRFYTERPESEAFGTHSGLGLAIARQIVEAIGGRIWAENRLAPAQGACFCVELPVSVSSYNTP